MLKSNLFYLDFKKHVGNGINWDSPIVDYNLLKKSLIQKLEDYIGNINDIRFKDFSTVKARAPKLKTAPIKESPFLKLKEAALYCKLSESTIHNDIRSGKLIYDAGNVNQGYKFTKETLDNYLGYRKKK